MNPKKVGGISVIKGAAGTMKGRIITFVERDLLLSQFGDRFKVPDLIGANWTIGKFRSDTGLAFRDLPGDAIFGVIVNCPDDSCEVQVYADKEPSEFQAVIDALGGISTWSEEVEKLGNIYSATYPGGSGSWDPIIT